MIEQFIESLNDKQAESIKHYKGPCMVYAGPGSGKTTVITHRVGYLVEQYNVDPSNILVISFTKAAADEMKQRFNANYSNLLSGKKRVNFGTFHSIFFRILRSYYRYDLNTIINEGQKYKVVKNIVKTLGVGNQLDDEFVKDVILDIGLFKSSITDKEEFDPNSMSKEDFDKVLYSYENYKKDSRRIDFDDMLTKCYELLIDQPKVLQSIRNMYQYILIDEFQDINSVQFEIIKLIASPDNNLFVVGDDDQSIYSFRGAEPSFILEFDKIYKDTKKTILDLNYRSPKNIINTANKLISHNSLRVEKKMSSVKDTGLDIEIFRPKTRELENKEINDLINSLFKEGYEYKDIAIIYRTNILSSSIVDSFLDNKIPFNSRERIYNIYEHWISKDVICYLKAGMNINDRESIRKIVNRPTRYITNKAIRQAENYHKDFITSLKVKGGLMDYQITYLDRLEVDLKTISHLEPRSAISYIRKDIGYDDHIRNYCLEKDIGSEGLIEILDELEETASKQSSIEDFINHIREFKESLYENKRNYSSTENQVELLTMHSAKGLEFKVVIIVEAVEDIIPHSKSLDNEGIEEERRLFYVAVTRSKERLYIFSPLSKYDKKADMSRFIYEMEILNEKKSKFKKGQEIIHKTFGRGIIKNKDKNKLEVKFINKSDVKELDMDICLQNNLIS